MSLYQVIVSRNRDRTLLGTNQFSMVLFTLDSLDAAITIRDTLAAHSIEREYFDYSVREFPE